jgi:hypothetical protein
MEIVGKRNDRRQNDNLMREGEAQRPDIERHHRRQADRRAEQTQ